MPIKVVRVGVSSGLKKKGFDQQLLRHQTNDFQIKQTNKISSKTNI